LLFLLIYFLLYSDFWPIYARESVSILGFGVFTKKHVETKN